MTEGPIGRQLVKFMVPVLVTQLLQQLYLMADAIVLGQFIGSAALAAQGTTALLISVISNFFIGVSAGISVLIGQLYGSGNDARLKAAINTSVTVSVLAGAVFTVLGIAGADLMLALLKTPDSVRAWLQGTFGYASSAWLRCFYMTSPHPRSGLSVIPGRRSSFCLRRRSST